MSDNKVKPLEPQTRQPITGQPDITDVCDIGDIGHLVFFSDGWAAASDR
jgi:hypothetical protein